jgi:hypothetical protein
VLVRFSRLCTRGFVPCFSCVLLIFVLLCLGPKRGEDFHFAFSSAHTAGSTRYCFCSHLNPNPFFLCCFAALTLGFVLGLDSAVSLALVAISDLCLGEYPVSHYDFSTRFFSPVAWISQLSPVLVPQCMHRVSSRFSFFSRSFSLCQSWVIQSELLVPVAVSHAQARSVVAQDQSGSIFHWG